MTRRATRFLVLACVLVAAATFSAQGGAQPATTVTVIPWLSTYQYKIVPTGDGAGFEQPNASLAGFSTGQAGFGDDPLGICFAFLNNPTYTNTIWPSGLGASSDILLRKSFDLPDGAVNAVLTIAIDNDVQVYVNGTNIFTGLHEGCAMRPPAGLLPSFVVPVPAAVLDEEDNLLAVRGIDHLPGVASYIDLELTAQCLPGLDDDNDGLENGLEIRFGLLENDADSDDDGILDGNEDSDDDGEDDEDEDDGDECPSDSDGDGEDDEDEDDDDDEDDD